MSIVAQMPQEYIQGTHEWLELRKTKITATDASIIMGASHWKTKTQLYQEKTSNAIPMFANEKMQRGLDLEPIARDLFTVKTGIKLSPKVVVKEWAMASLDGVDSTGKIIVEIKCPGSTDHATAVSGKVPDHYYPQLQHQMYVCNVDKMYYFSFDGADGVILEVVKNAEYLEKMLIEEMKFYQCLQSRTPPEPSENDYIERTDHLWVEVASRWKFVTERIKELEKEEEELRQQLISLTGDYNTRGSGISLCQIQRKGNVDYSKIPELRTVDLEKYRKPASLNWRITQY